MPRAPAPDQALAVALRRLREERGLTREAVAFNAGIAVASLARIENAKAAPSWDSVRRIIEALDVSLIELATAVETSAGT